MHEVLKDFSPASLASAVKSNLHAFFGRLAPGGAIRTGDGWGWHAWRTPIGYPWFNGVLLQRPAEEVEEGELDAALEFFVDYGGDMTCWLAPELDAEPWQRRLERRGLSYIADTPGMAIELDSLAAQAAVLPHLQIESVASAHALHEWNEVFVPGYGLPPAWGAACEVFCQAVGYQLPIRNYTGLLDGRPVATATLFLAAGVAGIMNVATLPEARRRGIGAAMTAAALLDGRSLGYRIGVLQSSEQGYPVYRRLGFSEVCKMDHFVGRVRKGTTGSS